MLPKVHFDHDVLDAVSAGVLPIRPGDMLKMLYTRKTHLIIIAGPQGAKADDAPAVTGQWIEFLIADQNGGSLSVAFLDWSGYRKFWEIIRPE